MKKLLLTVVTIGALFLLTGSANALLMLELDDGTTTVTVVDEGAGDAFAGVGTVSYVGSLGGASTWSINVTTGVGDPAIGNSSYPQLDLNSVNVTALGTAGGSLQITLVSTDLTPSTNVPGFVSNVGGTTNGSVMFSTYYDTTNNNGDTSAPDLSNAVLLSSLGSFGPGAYSGTDSTSVVVNPQDTVALSIVADLTHTSGGQTTSFDLQVTPTPEPTTMLLFGSGLVGLAGLRRIRRKRLQGKK